MLLFLPLVQLLVVEDEAVEWGDETDVGEHKEGQAHTDDYDTSV